MHLSNVNTHDDGPKMSDASKKGGLLSGKILVCVRGKQLGRLCGTGSGITRLDLAANNNEVFIGLPRHSSSSYPFT